MEIVARSPSKDVLYEVAGDLIQQIPATLFKLNQALRASALCASKMDYEQLKSEVLPVKNEELDQALEDVRVRTRLVPGDQPMNPKTAAQHIRTAAEKLKDTRSFTAALPDLMLVVAALEEAPTEEPSDKLSEVVATLETLAESVDVSTRENPVSKVATAKTLRDLIGQHVENADAFYYPAFTNVPEGVRTASVSKVAHPHLAQVGFQLMRLASVPDPKGSVGDSLESFASVLVSLGFDGAARRVYEASRSLGDKED